MRSGIVKYSSSSKLEPIFLPEGGKSISYMIIVSSLNGVYTRSSLHGIKLNRMSQLRFHVVGANLVQSVERWPVDGL